MAFTYFTNDQSTFVHDEVEQFKESPIGFVDDSQWDKDNIFDFMVDYLRENDHENEKEVKAILSSMDMTEAGSDDNFYDFLEAFCKDRKAFDAMLNEYADILWTDDYIFPMHLEWDREYADDLLKEDGFIGKNEKYIILGSNMGWRHREGMKESTINSMEDLERAVTGDYDYTITVERESMETPWITCHVSSHDAPMGETYYCVPVKWLDKALLNDSIKEMYDSMKHLLDDEMESA